MVALVKLVRLPKFIVALVKPVSVSSLLSSLPKLEGFPVCIMGCAVLFRTELLRSQTAQKDFTEPEPPILQYYTASTSTMRHICKRHKKSKITLARDTNTSTITIETGTSCRIPSHCSKMHQAYPSVL